MSFLYYPSIYASRKLAEIEVETALKRSRIATEIALDRAYTVDALRRSRVAAEIAAEDIRRERLAVEV